MTNEQEKQWKSELRRWCEDEYVRVSITFVEMLFPAWKHQQLIIDAKDKELAEVRAKLVAAEENLSKQQALTSAAIQVGEIAQRRADKAEARIKVSQEQEPVAWAWKFNEESHDDWRLSLGPHCPTYREDCETMEFYAQPPIPPDVAELQRQLEETRKVPKGMKLVSESLLDEFPEINLSNYGHDEVRAINQWGIDVVLSAAPTTDQPKEQI